MSYNLYFAPGNTTTWELVAYNNCDDDSNENKSNENNINEYNNEYDFNAEMSQFIEKQFQICPSFVTNISKKEILSNASFKSGIFITKELRIFHKTNIQTKGYIYNGIQTKIDCLGRFIIIKADESQESKEKSMQIEELLKELDERDDCVRQMKMEYEELNREMCANFEVYEDNIKIMENNIGDLTDENSCLIERNETLSENLIECSNENTQLKLQLAELLQSKESTNEIISQLNKQIDEFQKNRDYLEKDLKKEMKMSYLYLKQKEEIQKMYNSLKATEAYSTEKSKFIAKEFGKLEERLEVEMKKNRQLSQWNNELNESIMRQQLQQISTSERKPNAGELKSLYNEIDRLLMKVLDLETQLQDERDREIERE